MNSPIDKLKFSPDPFNISQATPSECNCDVCTKRREIAARLGVPVEAVQAIAIVDGVSMPINFGPTSASHAAPVAKEMPTPPNLITAFDVGGAPDRPGAINPSPPPTPAIDDSAALDAELDAYGLPRSLVWTAKAFAVVVCSIYVAWTFASVWLKRNVLRQRHLNIVRREQ